MARPLPWPGGRVEDCRHGARGDRTAAASVPGGGDRAWRRPARGGAGVRLGARRVAALAGTAVLAAALWWRRNPSACPYSQRFWVQAPHPLITRPRLREALAPAPGQRILEVGPGTGYYALEVAGWIAPGHLDVF